LAWAMNSYVLRSSKCARLPMQFACIYWVSY